MAPSTDLLRRLIGDFIDVAGRMTLVSAIALAVLVTLAVLLELLLLGVFAPEPVVTPDLAPEE